VLEKRLLSRYMIVREGKREREREREEGAGRGSGAYDEIENLFSSSNVTVGNQ